MGFESIQILITIIGLVQLIVVGLLSILLKNQLSMGTSMATIKERLQHIPTFREMQDADRESRHAAYGEAHKDVADVEIRLQKLTSRVEEIDRNIPRA